MMSAKLRRIEQAVSTLANVRLVSITVDPARDTPNSFWWMPVP